MTTVHARTAAEWREWLSRNASTASDVWLVIPHTRSGSPGISHRQAIEEALCFGWIDGRAHRDDEGSWRQRFTPRSPRSA